RQRKTVKRKQRIEITAFRRQRSVYLDNPSAIDGDAPSQTIDPIEPANSTVDRRRSSAVDFARASEMTRLIKAMLEANEDVTIGAPQSNNYLNWASAMVRQLRLTLRRITRSK